jgi:hypothetical protein
VYSFLKANENHGVISERRRGASEERYNMHEKPIKLIRTSLPDGFNFIPWLINFKKTSNNGINPIRVNRKPEIHTRWRFNLFNKQNRMKSLYVFSMILLSIMIIGCMAEKSNSTQINTRLDASFSPVTSTDTALETVDFIHHNFQVNHPTTGSNLSAPSSTAMPNNSITPTRTPSPLRLPTNEGVKYSPNIALIQPQAKSLLDVIKIINIQYAAVQQNYENQPEETKKFLIDELSEVNDFLDVEIRRLYPNGLPNPQLIWNYYPLKSDWFKIFPPIYLELLNDGIFSKINDSTLALEDNKIQDGNDYSIHPYRVELDGDSGSEWLLLIRWKALGALTWLTLDEISGPIYVKLDTGLPSLNWASNEFDDNIKILKDFTGDGLTDVIFLDYGYLWGTDFGTFYVAKGTPDGFVLIGEHSQSIPGYLSSGLIFDIGTPEKSNWLTLTLFNPNSISWDCYWETATSYRWPNAIEQVSISGENPPNSANCNLARAVNLDNPPDVMTSILLLENALSRFDVTNSDQFAKAQFTHFRLAILYAIEGLDIPAREHLRTFIDAYSQSEAFKNDKLLPLLFDQPINPIKLCSVMESAPQSQLPRDWNEYVNLTAVLNVYPKAVDPYPPAICPLSEILLSKLASIQFDARYSPEAEVIRSGIPVVNIQSYPIPFQSHPAWFVLIGTEAMYEAGYVPGKNGWEWQLLNRFSPSTSAPQIVNNDITGDGYPELAVVIQSDDHWGCDVNEQLYELFLTTATKIGFISMDRVICSSKKPLDLLNYLMDNDGDGQVDWVNRQIEDAIGNASDNGNRIGPISWFTPSEIQSWIQGMENDVNDPQKESNILEELYNSANPQDERQHLINERDLLNLDDPLTPRKWQRLTYLIGICYELEGMDEQAIQEYISIINAKPLTIWTSLADLHIRMR